MAADMKNLDGTINFTYASDNPITPPITIVDTNTGERFEDINPHWYTTPEAVEDMHSAENPFDFGIASHEYQDSFSHWQKLGEPETAMGIWGGHLVNDITTPLGLSESIDNYSINNPIDQAMTSGYTTLVGNFVTDQVYQWNFYGH
jgi:hypothetical protein